MIPSGWKIERQADVLKTIHITAPNGYVASVSAIDRNPANVLYMLADTLLKGTDAEIYKSIADNYTRGVAADVGDLMELIGEFGRCVRDEPTKAGGVLHEIHRRLTGGVDLPDGGQHG